MCPATLACRGRRLDLATTEVPLRLEELVPGDAPWEVEIGFGKGRYLIDRATAEPEQRFLGIEVASKYFRLVETRLGRRGADNTVLLLGEALYLMSTALPRGFASLVHVYFPDPWPKERHHKRRLFDSDNIDLLLAMLRPGGRLLFASDFLDYGELVAELLESHPALRVKRHSAWPGGSRTNYELKYEREGRPIVRLEAELCDSGDSLLHPGGRTRCAVGDQAAGVGDPSA